jgi:hypothetical protein
MSAMNALLMQCLDITKQLISIKQKATIAIKIGSDFSFEFCKKDETSPLETRKQSPKSLRITELKMK